MNHSPRQLVSGLLAGFAFSLAGAAQAEVIWDYTFSDLGDGAYWGRDNSTGYADRDVIGDVSKFEVVGARVRRETRDGGDWLTITIESNFIGRSHQGLFSGYTHNGKGVGYGDLFLAAARTPFGAGPHYVADDADNGTQWKFALAFEDSADRWSNASGGSADLWDLDDTSGNAGLLRADDFMKGSAIYRAAAAVAVDTAASGNGVVGQGTWSSDNLNNLLTYEVDITGTGIADWDGLAMQWQMTCGNDIIQDFGDNAVPEPSVLALLGLGLLGFAGRLRRGARAATAQA